MARLTRADVHRARMRPFYVIRRSDDTGEQAIATQHSNRAVAEQIAADLTRSARRYGFAVTYTVIQPLTTAILAGQE